MQDRGQEVIVSLYMDNTLYADSPSRNLLIDLVGSEKPDEYGEHSPLSLTLSISPHSLTPTLTLFSARQWSWRLVGYHRLE
jgi:hypothetical protein